MMYKNIALVILFGISFLFGWLYMFASKDSNPTDDSLRYLREINALSVKADSLVAEIEIKDRLIEMSKQKRDSLVDYQIKIYKYYDKRISEFNALDDSSHVELFINLTRQRTD